MSKDVCVFEGNPSRDSSVGTGTGYMLDGHETDIRFAVVARHFYLLHSILFGSGVPSNLLSSEHKEVFLLGKTVGA
jgi:hypothetical protein